MQSAFEKAVEKLPHAPPCVVVIRDTHWASKFEDKPVNPIQVGLRLLSGEDQSIVLHAIAKAKADAVESGGDEVAVANMAALVTTVARAMCHPKDATRGHEFFSAPDDLIPIALRPETIRWLFDEIEKTQIETSPIFTEATDEGVEELVDSLILGQVKALEEADPARAKRVRRYIEFIRSELE